MKTTVERIRALMRVHTGVPVSSVKRLPGGFNCALYKIIDSKDNAFLVKKYIHREVDTKDRLQVEFSALRYLWRHGIRTIPEPILKSTENQIGVYRFINGTKFTVGKCTYKDMVTAVSFWRRIHGLIHLASSRKLPHAKEACFTMGDYYETVEKRFRQLQKIAGVVALRELYAFLENEFIPFYRQVRQFITVEYKRAGIDAGQDLQKERRTLSPSDFGFHNAIRTYEGSIIFHDFEYFGWDDPAKMIADFYLHPRMRLPFQYREFFYRNVVHELGDPMLPKRLPCVYMLLSLKWCLIMLNVFTGGKTTRGARRLIAKTQLAKAKARLGETIAELEMRSFPLSLLG